MTTCVANATGYVLWAQVNANPSILSQRHEKVKSMMDWAREKLYSFETDAEIANSVKYEAIHVAQTENFSRISIFTCMRYLPSENRGTGNISIFYQERKDGPFVPIVTTFKIPTASNVIVTKQLQIKISQRDNTWIDTDGHDHSKQNKTSRNHLANGSDHPIWALLDVNRTYTSKISQKIAALKGAKQFFEAEMYGYTCIEPEEVHCFEPNGYDGPGNVYYSVFKEQDDGLQLITGSMERPRSTSIIISRLDKVHLERHGTLWVDTDGVNHRR